ncbi:MAG: hypothetical protein PHQ52_06500 [Candidatus Omnitrophica bacterium]|nr:hypothetical protein [Candidatus Omnitrophota bacterium]
MKKNFYIVLLAITTLGNMMSSVFAEPDNIDKNIEVLDEREIAQTVLESIFNVFENYTFIDFAGKISEEFNPSRNEFITNVDESFYEKDVLSLDFFMETVDLTENNLAVVFKWEKKLRDKDTGIVDLKQGRAEFVFVWVNDKWMLIKVAGDDPFLV